MFRIKICGLTHPDDVDLVAAAGADAVGLNFYPKSPRFLAPEQAEAVARRVPQSLCKVGLFVNAPIEQVLDYAARYALDLVQLHGDEPPEYLAQLQKAATLLGGKLTRGKSTVDKSTFGKPSRSARSPGAGEVQLPLMRALRLGPEGTVAIDDYLVRCHHLGCLPQMLLIDAHRSGSYGGTGQTADWGLLANWTPVSFIPPLVLAGGLTPENVAAAIARVRPAAVDTASGVERTPGRKEPQLVQAFVTQAQEGWRA